MVLVLQPLSLSGNHYETSGPRNQAGQPFHPFQAEETDYPQDV
jgi:hypothetical protein